VSGIERKSPFSALLRDASRLPAHTGIVARFERRLASAGITQVILADVSASMAESAGARRRVDVLREALTGVPPARIVAFATTPVEIASATALPPPSGGTALHLALDLGAAMRPARTLVVSDGEPDDEAAALRSAEDVPGTIDVIYCGPDGNVAARAFLMRLARAGGGRYVSHDMRHPELLAPAIRGLLSGGGT
jgi:hypothetical protein